MLAGQPRSLIDSIVIVGNGEKPCFKSGKGFGFGLFVGHGSRYRIIDHSAIPVPLSFACRMKLPNLSQDFIAISRREHIVNRLDAVR